MTLILGCIYTWPTPNGYNIDPLTTHVHEYYILKKKQTNNQTNLTMIFSKYELKH